MDLSRVAQRATNRFLNSGGNNRRPGITWGQWLGGDDCPYMHRWIVNLGFCSIRLHHWVGSDDPRALHDHPWPFVTFVFWGGYTDISAQFPELVNLADVLLESIKVDGLDSAANERVAPSPYTSLVKSTIEAKRETLLTRDYVRAPAVRFRPARHAHTVQVDPGGAWTLIITSRHMRDWGFWVDGQWKRMRKYFREHGHHQCD